MMFTKFNQYSKLYQLNEWNYNNDGSIDRDVIRKIREAIVVIMTNFGFFSDLLFQLRIVQAKKDCKTMQTDGKKIAFSPNFVKRLTVEQVVFVLCHEILHNSMLHFDRQMGRNPQIWNYAGDFVINLMLTEMKMDNLIQPTNGLLIDKKYENMSAEQVYEELIEEYLKKKQKQQGGGGSGDDDDDDDDDGQGGQPGQGKPKPPKQGQGGLTPEEVQDLLKKLREKYGVPSGDKGEDGQGSGGVLVPEDIKEPGDIQSTEDLFEPEEGQESGNPEMTDADKTELARLWAEARKKAGSSNRSGTGSVGLDRFIKGLEKPRVNWKVKLRKFVSKIFSKQDFSPWNKKYIGRGMYLNSLKPSGKGGYKDVVVAIDTSGSIGDDELSYFASELMGVFEKRQIDNCYIVWCDDKISNIQQVDIKASDKKFDLRRLRPKGYGGTSFIPPFKWVKGDLKWKNSSGEYIVFPKGKYPTFMIYFTDGDQSPIPPKHYVSRFDDRVLWVIKGKDSDAVGFINFGEKLLVDFIGKDGYGGGGTGVRG